MIVFHVVLVLIGYTMWFLWALNEWKMQSTECHEGWNSLDLYNFIMLTVFTGWPACITLVLLSGSLICLPCIVIGLNDFFVRWRERALERKDIISTIVRTNWNPDDFEAFD